jgi:hypothetical protein
MDTVPVMPGRSIFSGSRMRSLTEPVRVLVET